jgi:hypothetical protein
MKITKEKLIQIIKEELDNMVDESLPSHRYNKTSNEIEAKKAAVRQAEAEAAGKNPPRTAKEIAASAVKSKAREDSSYKAILIAAGNFPGATINVSSDDYNKMIELGLREEFPEQWKALSIK